MARNLPSLTVRKEQVIVKNSEAVLNPYVTLGLRVGMMTLGTLAVLYSLISRFSIHLP